MDQDLALEILRLFDTPNSEGWDLHGFFEFVGGDDPGRRIAVFDTVDQLSAAGFLENRGSDFYTITEKGMMAAAKGSFNEWELDH